MGKYCFYILVGVLACSNSYAISCNNKCVLGDYHERDVVQVCHLDCVERCRITRIEKNSPLCIEKLKSEIEFLNNVVEKAQSTAAGVIEIAQ